jgi:CheY-like chemotaxis protein
MPKILHFENEKFLADMYAIKFQQAGFEYVHFSNPTKNPVGIILREKPNVILSDVIMPVMDGFTAAKIYKSDARTKHIPLIFLSNLGQKEDIETGLSLGGVKYVVKAVHSPSDVVSEVRKVLSLDSQHSEHGGSREIMRGPDQELADIKARNARVEADKAWETSWTRRLIIAVFTYVVAAVWLLVIEDTDPFLKAIIPAAGYILSTLSIGRVKQQWIRSKLQK